MIRLCLLMLLLGLAVGCTPPAPATNTTINPGNTTDPINTTNCPSNTTTAAVDVVQSAAV